jgi:hypothetical protein
MSKMDGLRAMREARFEEAASRGATKPTTVTEPGDRRARETAEVHPPSVDHADATPALCGHRAISGRTCTRAHGHASKSHRYS